MCVTALPRRAGDAEDENHEWSYDNEVANDERYKGPWRDVNQVLRDVKVEVDSPRHPREHGRKRSAV